MSMITSGPPITSPRGSAVVRPSSADQAPPKTEVSLLRLYLLRASYLLIAVGLGSEIWPAIFHHRPWDLWHGVGCCLLGALSALALLGLRYPLKMLPLLMFEMVWKATWMIAVALPLWRAHKMDQATSETAFACSLALIFLVTIPWPYLARTFLLGPGDRWR